MFRADYITVPAGKTVILPEIETVLSGKAGSAESEYNGIAIWNIRGDLLLTDEQGQHIPFRTQTGFIDTAPLWRKDSWRILYLHHPESGQTVAVTQSWRERLATLLNTVWTQLVFSLLALPLMIWLLRLAVSHSIKPLTALADELAARQAMLSPVTRAVPQETQPLVDALNRLFARVQTTIEREQRFTADAAHELRSPLAALKVQTEVLVLSNADEQPHHIRQIQNSLQRAEHLINQLLTLARLDPEQGIRQPENINWNTLTNQVLQHLNLNAREKHIRLTRKIAHPPMPLKGNPELLQLLLRNLLDNAVRYSPPNSEVSLHINTDTIDIRDQGKGIAPEHLPRIKERFYRPSGQNAEGSGLGLSIAEHIAGLHGLTMTLENVEEGGLRVVLQKKEES